MKQARRPATYDDLRRVPEHLVAEIVDGELFTSPRPATPHARAASLLGSELIGGFDGPPGGADAPGGWWLLIEPELHFGADVVVPDLAGWRRANLAAIPNAPAITVAPDWLCEVLSPSTARLDRAHKMRVYAREGVGHLWLLDPVARILEIYRLETEHWVLVATHEGDDAIRAEPFEAMTLTMRRWWLEP
ncbi:MAG: Uma2 family endonuclease [Candidatus Binatia bacterium]